VRIAQTDVYRILSKVRNTDQDWLQEKAGYQGRPRIYSTLGTARGVKTRLENEGRRYSPDGKGYYEYKIQKASSVWEDVE